MRFMMVRYAKGGNTPSSDAKIYCSLVAVKRTVILAGSIGHRPVTDSARGVVARSICQNLFLC